MRFRSAGFFVSLALVATSAHALTVDELLAKNLEARGGADKVAAIKTLKVEGKLRFGEQFELGLVQYQKAPDLVRSEASIQGLTAVQAWDGKDAWQISPFQGRKDPEKMSADDAKDLSEDAADFAGVLVDYKAKGYTLDYLGTEDVDGTDAYKVRVTRPNGDITYVFLDPDYFLEIRTVTRRIQHGVPKETVTDYGDYEQVNGIYYAFAQASGPNGSSDRNKVQFDKAEANTSPDESVFRFPAAPAPAATK